MELRKLLKNKKAGYTDIFIFMIVALCIIFICVLFVYMGNTITLKLHQTMDNMTNDDGSGANYSQAIDQSMGAVNTAYASLYWISIFLIFGMIVAILIGSYLVQTKPVFFIPYIFIMIIAIFVSVGLSNAYEDVMADPTLASTFEGFLGANFIMLNLPIIITIVGFAGGIVMFIRMDRGQEQYYG